MKCPKCGGDVIVFNTRNISENRVGRQRSCRECKYCFVTVEEVAENDEEIRKEMRQANSICKKKKVFGLKRYLMCVNLYADAEMEFEVSATSEEDAIGVGRHYICRNYPNWDNLYNLKTIKVVRKV